MIKPYAHLPNYLHRWQLGRVGRLSLRLHKILSPDTTPFLHTHPFAYVSIVLSGGYTEQVLVGDAVIEKAYTTGSVIVHKHTTFHRIKTVQPNTKTLFFVWNTTAEREQGWKMMRHPDIVCPSDYIDYPDGLYWTGKGYRNRKDGMWYALRSTVDQALRCDRLSIHQHRAYCGESTIIVNRTDVPPN
jgi:hypothetical protein